MTLTQQCKALGLPSAKALIDATGYTRQNLDYMRKSNPAVFELLCLGLVSKLNN